jgi:hypothetical protein
LLKKSSCWEEVGRIREHKKSSLQRENKGRGKVKGGGRKEGVTLEKKERTAHAGLKWNF